MKSKTVAAAIALAGFFVAAYSTPAQAQAAQQTPETEQTKVTIDKGDTLTKVATAHQTTYVRIYDANTQIAHPDVIHPGDVVRIPAPDEQLASRPLPAAAAAAASASAAAPARSTASAATSSYKPKRSSAVSRPVADASVPGGVWDKIAQCESGGNWSINTGNGYYGGLQFTLSSWRGVGGSGYPHHASKAEQIARAERLLAKQGWGAWPACSKKLGLR